MSDDAHSSRGSMRSTFSVDGSASVDARAVRVEKYWADRLIAMFRAIPDPPCNKCRLRAYCKTADTACLSFYRYVKDGSKVEAPKEPHPNAETMDLVRAA